MAGKVDPIPKGYQAVMPYLIVKGAAQAIAFYTEAFGATERMRYATPEGLIGHAELSIGGSVVMLADEHPEMGAAAPETVGGSPVSFSLYAADVDALVARATGLGATVIRPVEDKFYGDRAGTLRDPFGHTWHVATHKEDLSPEEFERRAAAQAEGADEKE
jgi:PhnB protein